MIHVNELRIGNWVEKFTDLGDSLGYSPISPKEFLAIHTNPERVNPVPLTEEILLKCGFVRRGITSNNGGKLTLHHKDNMYPNGRVYWNSWCILDSIPEHLHQLQNLYFALTGEELEINL